MKPPAARWLALVVAMALVLWLCWLMLAPFVDVLLWSVVLAMLSYPVFQRLRRRAWSAHGAALLTTFGIVLVVLIPVSLIAAAVVRQASGAVEAVERGISYLLDPHCRLVEWAGQYVDVEPLRDPKALAGHLGKLGGAIASRTLGIIGGVLGGVVQVFFVLFTVYYLLRDADRIVPAVRDALPLPSSSAHKIIQRMQEVIAASVKGVLIIAGVQGMLGMFAFWALGLSAPILWGVVMFILSTIPMLGAFLVWIPAAIFLLATGHWIRALLLTLWGSLVIGMIDNVLRPKLVGQRARLHELIIFFSVLGGLQVFGVLGVFVGPVVAAIALALLEVIREANAESEVAQAALEQVVLQATTAPAAAAPPPGAASQRLNGNP